MKYNHAFLAALTVVSFAGHAVLAQQVPTTRAVAPDGVTLLLPEMKFVETPLDDVIAQVQKQVPGFECVVVREAGVPANMPLISMRIANCDSGQFLGILNFAYPELSIENIPSDSGARITAIKVTNQLPPQSAKPTGERLTRFFGLDYAVTSLLPRDVFTGSERLGSPEYKAKREAYDKERESRLQELVPLLANASITADPESAKVGLQLHPGTGVVIAKGTAKQLNAIAGVLNAIDPKRYPAEAVAEAGPRLVPLSDPGLDKMQRDLDNRRVQEALDEKKLGANHSDVVRQKMEIRVMEQAIEEQTRILLQRLAAKQNIATPQP